MKTLLAFMMLCGAAFAQLAQPVKFVQVDPSTSPGAGTVGTGPRYNFVNGKLWNCHKTTGTACTWESNSSGGGSVFTGSKTTSTTGIGGTAAAPTFDGSDQSVKSPLIFKFTLSTNVTTPPVFNNFPDGARWAVEWLQPASVKTVNYGSIANVCDVGLSHATYYTRQWFVMEGTTVVGDGCPTNDPADAPITVISGDGTTPGSGSGVLTITKVNGVSSAASPATDSVQVVTASNTRGDKVIPDCPANALGYTQSTHAFGCNTITGSGTVSVTTTNLGYLLLPVETASWATVTTFNDNHATPEYYQFVLNWTQKFTTIQFWNTSSAATATGFALALYDSTCAKVTNGDATSVSVNNTGNVPVPLTFASPPTLSPGIYNIGWVTDNAALVPEQLTANGVLWNIMANNGGAFRAFTGGNTATGSGTSLAMPATCGTKTANTTRPPLIFIAEP